MSTKYWRNDIKKDKKVLEQIHIQLSICPPLFSRSLSCDWTRSSTVSGRSWYGRPDNYLVTKLENLLSFLFYTDPTSFSSKRTMAHHLVNNSVACQTHHEVQSLCCTLQPKCPTVTDCCVSMLHADISCFWL